MTDALVKAAADPRQLSLLEVAAPAPPVETPRPRARYVYALVTRDTLEIQVPVYASRREARESLAWNPQADNLKIERCRILVCRREGSS